MEARMKTLPGLMDVTSDLEISNPQVNLTIERNKASQLGVSAYQIEDALSYAYSSTQVSTIYAPDNEYKVILELEPQYQEDPSVLSLLYIRSSSDKLVPLDSVVSMEKTVGPLQVNHTGQLPSVTISFNLMPGVSLGNAVSEIDGLAHKTIPANIITSFQGTAQAFESSMKGLGMLLIMTILIIYMVLGILYESFIHPITILSALPFAGFGALLTLLIFHVDLNIYSFVGIIMLVGLVKKNGIMMIDFAVETERTHYDDDRCGNHRYLTDSDRAWCRCRLAPAAGACSSRGTHILSVPHPVHHACFLRIHGFLQQMAAEGIANQAGHRTVTRPLQISTPYNSIPGPG
jgi:HAE1 family hydrophobic/amphiphilic exporter-1